jgi:hypothetical protein
VCVYGKVYPAASTASDILREEYAPHSKKKFIADWVNTKMRKNDVFYISKDFYKYVKDNEIGNINKDMYENWVDKLTDL